MLLKKQPGSTDRIATINLKGISDKGGRDEEKNYWILLGLIAAMVLVFNPIAQAKEEQVTLVNPVEQLDELGRFQAFNTEGGVLLVDTKMGRTWLYHRGNWHINPFVEGQPFPGDGKFSIISPEKPEKKEKD